MCRGEEHHVYHVGLLVNDYLDKVFLDASCAVDSPYRKLLTPTKKFIYPKSRFHFVLQFLKSVGSPGTRTIIVGIPTKWIPIIAIFRIFGKKIEIQVHGQIAAIKDKNKYLIWMLMSKFVYFTVANSIWAGPSFVHPIGNVGAFQFLPKKNNSGKNCLLYGANKRYLQDLDIRQSISQAGFEIVECLNSAGGYVTNESIVRAAAICNYTFVQMDYSHYKLSPSARYWDLTILNLVPLVLKSDIGTQKILNEHGMKFVLI